MREIQSERFHPWPRLMPANGTNRVTTNSRGDTPRTPLKAPRKREHLSAEIGPTYHHIRCMGGRHFKASELVRERRTRAAGDAPDQPGDTPQSAKTSLPRGALAQFQSLRTRRSLDVLPTQVPHVAICPVPGGSTVSVTRSHLLPRPPMLRVPQSGLVFGGGHADRPQRRPAAGGWTGDKAPLVSARPVDLRSS
jgi:hypothetical protein